MSDEIDLMVLRAQMIKRTDEELGSLLATAEMDHLTAEYRVVQYEMGRRDGYQAIVLGVPQPVWVSGVDDDYVLGYQLGQRLAREDGKG